MSEVIEKKTVAGLFNTTNEDEQVKAIEQLAQMAQAPIAVMTIILDTRQGKTDITLNGQFTFEEIYTLLDIARREVTRREREALLQQQQDKTE